jgi:hypothetical protein
MIFKTEKKIKHALVLEEEDLKKISSFIIERYKKIEITAKCNDKTVLRSENIDDIVSFENQDFRRIIAISMEGRNSFEESLYITIEEKSYEESTAEFSISSDKEEDVNYISKKLTEWFLGTKPGYSFMSRISSFWVFLGLACVVAVILNLYWDVIGKTILDTSKLSATEVFNLAFFAFFIIYIICSEPIKKFRKWLFPAIFFLLGKQKKTMKKIENIRIIVFIVIFLGLAINILGNILSK